MSLFLTIYIYKSGKDFFFGKTAPKAKNITICKLGSFITLRTILLLPRASENHESVCNLSGSVKHNNVLQYDLELSSSKVISESIAIKPLCYVVLR